MIIPSVCRIRRGLRVVFGVVVAAWLAGPAGAQEPKSGPLAKELAQLLDQHKLTVIAAKAPGTQDQYVAALYFPGSQLLVVSARYAVPLYIEEKLTKKEFMEVYIDLNSASIPESKVFVSDLQANGLQPRPEEGQPFDTYEAGGSTFTFDRNWRKKNITEEEYMKRFSEADDRYAQLLSVLIAQLKRS